MLSKIALKIPFCILTLLLLLSCKAMSSKVAQSTSAITQASDSLAVEYIVGSDGTQLAYRDSGGDYPPILLLHPMTGSAEIWQKQYSALANMGFRIIGLSLRGAGLSGPLPPVEHQDDQDILALLNHLNVNQVHLVGAAAGGITALRFTVEYPERVSSLVISNSYAGLLAAELVELSQTFSPPNSLPSLFKELGPAYRYAALKQKGSNELVEWQRIYENSKSAKLASLKDDMRKQWYAKILGSLATEEEIQAIKQSVLLIYGGADLLMPPPAGKDVQQRFNNAKLLVIPQAGHAAHWEFPDMFNTAVSEFVAEQDNQ